MRRLFPSLTVALTGLVAACGTATVPPEEQGRRPAAWVEQSLPSERGADSPLVGHATDEGVVVATTTEDGTLVTHWSRDGYDFRAGRPAPTGLTYFSLGGVAAHAGGWVALGSGGTARVDGDDELTFEVAALRSDDALAWERAPVEGFAGPADVADLVSVDGALVAAGAYRDREDPGMGGFRAVAWTSRDGTSWHEVALPGSGEGDSHVSDLAVSGDRLLATGQTGSTGVLWVSDDHGDTWSRVDDPTLEAWALVGVAADGATVVVSAEDDGSRFLVSRDAGSTWTETAQPPPTAGAEGYAPVWAGGGRFFTITSTFLEGWSEPEVCYADITLCQQDSQVRLYASDDGDVWQRVDTSGIGAGEAGEVDEVAGTPSGAVVALRGEGGPAAYTWPAGQDLPTTSEETVPRARLVEVPESGPEVGVRYHQPLYLHCGMDRLHLGDRSDQVWQRADEGPDVETGAGGAWPEHWPVAQQYLFGYATLVDADTLEYTLEDGEVVARYRRGGAALGCD